MPVPTAYTEPELLQFMVDVLASVADILDWNVASSELKEALIETLIGYGITDIASATDLKKLRTLARMEAWRAVMQATAGDFNFQADGGTYSRAQVHAQAMNQFKLAESSALPYLSTYKVSSVQVVYPDDVYRTQDEIDEDTDEWAE